MEKIIPKILIAAPTSDRHADLLEEWIRSIEKLTYKNFDVCLVENTVNSDEYFNKLKEVKINGKPIITWKYEWDPEKIHHLQMLAYVREEIRQYFLEHEEYTHLFWLDQDILIPKDTLQRLLYADKDHVGFIVPVFYKPKRVPCVFKSGNIVIGKGLEYFSWNEVNYYRKIAKKAMDGKLSKEEQLLSYHIFSDLEKPYLMKVYAVNLGCLLIKRDVVKQCPYRTHPTFIWGEDLWYFNEANDKKFEFWADVTGMVIHKNKSWDILNECKKIGPTPFYVIYGPANPTGAEIVTHNTI